MDEVVRELHKVKDEIINGKICFSQFLLGVKQVNAFESNSLSLPSSALSHQTRNRQNQYILISPEQQAGERERLEEDARNGGPEECSLNVSAGCRHVVPTFESAGQQN